MLVTKSNYDWTILAPAKIQTILNFVSRKPGGFDESQLLWDILCHFWTLKLERRSPGFWVRGSEGCAQLPHQEANIPPPPRMVEYPSLEKWAIALNKRDGIKEKAFMLAETIRWIMSSEFWFPEWEYKNLETSSLPSKPFWGLGRWAQMVKFLLSWPLGTRSAFPGHLGCFWESPWPLWLTTARVIFSAKSRRLFLEEQNALPL
jgi:hypothetical protein